FTNQTQQAIAEEVESLSRVYRRGGLATLVHSVDRRARQPGAFLYLIADPNGRILSGNVAELEPGLLNQVGWTPRPFWYRRYGESEETERYQALAEVIRIPNQLILM